MTKSKEYSKRKELCSVRQKGLDKLKRMLIIMSVMKITEGSIEMQNTYTIPEVERENVKKQLEKLQTKAAKYGCHVEFSFGETYGKMIPVRRISDDGREVIDVTEVPYEVCDITIDSDIVRNGDYTVIAHIEHTEDGNIISGSEIKPEWWTIKAKCEHCNRSHPKHTYMVRNSDGTEKQVGRTCLKDYCGIDPQLVGLNKQIIEILEQDDPIAYDWEEKKVRQAIDVEKTLALSFQIFREYGYTKSGDMGCNKDRLNDAIHEHIEPKANDLETAKKMIEDMKDISEEEASKFLLGNIKTISKRVFTNISNTGYIAYAPVAYRKWIQYKEEQANKPESNYVGKVGEKIQEQIKDAICLSSWDNGFGLVYLYKITTVLGNILIWKTSSFILDMIQNGASSITGTVKEYQEYKGVKQTVVTRCKIK